MSRIKEFIKSVIGEKNTARVRNIRQFTGRIRQSAGAARAMWSNTGTAFQSHTEKVSVWCLMQVHMLEKALAVKNTKYLEAVKYPYLLSRLEELLRLGMSPDNFTIKYSAAIIRSALSQVSGHDDDKKALEDFIAWNDVAMDFRGGIDRIPKDEIFAHNDFDFGAFVRARHSVRRFKDKIVSREVIHEIVKDALYCPSACNRQPFKVYFSENPETIKRITAKFDGFVSPYVHDALIVTCDRNLLMPPEMNDQEYVNGGIFLGYLVLSIHAHGLGSCLFQFLQLSSRQESIRREFGISPSEVISAFVGIGEPEDEVLCACAQRRPVEEVAVCLD